MGWTQDLWNIAYPSLTTPTPLNARKSFLMTEHWVEIYSNQKDINYISPSNIRASVETRLPKLHNLLQFPPPSRFCDTRISSFKNIKLSKLLSGKWFRLSLLRIL